MFYLKFLRNRVPVDGRCKNRWVIESSICFATLDLSIDLHTHAADGRVEDQICDAVKNLCKFLSLGDEHRYDVKDASEHHDAVGKSNHAIVARITSNVVHIHEINT